MARIKITGLHKLEQEIGRRLAEEIDRMIADAMAGDPRFKPLCAECGSDNIVEVRAAGERFFYCGDCRSRFE